MIGRTVGHRWGFMAPAVAALFLLAGCDSGEAPGATAETTLSAAPTTTSPATSPTTQAPESLPISPTTEAPGAGPAPDASALPAVLAASEPVTLEIPVIGVRTDLLSLGLRENRSLEVPPAEPGSPASWYNQSPTPGDRGPAVMLGHVNATDGGEGVFADLRDLEVGDRISVVREDGSTAVFEFQRGEQYMKDEFPTFEVYGNTEGSELRLITCDGYNPDTGEFDDNYVVYASLVTV